MSIKRYVLTAAVLAASIFSVGSAYAAQGCGPGGWRGPWGHCHFARYAPAYVTYAPPQVVVVTRPMAYASAVCPAGYWTGPWGHCRNTPYHGRLPNGEWQ